MANEFYKIIDSFREADESNTKFAKRLGIHPSMLRYWEKGMTPKPATIRKIVKALKIENPVKKQLFIVASPETRSRGYSVNRGARQNALPFQRPQERAVNQIDDNGFVSVPVICQAMDGPHPTLSPQDGWFHFRANWVQTIASDVKNLFTREIWEQDMIPTLQPGDIVLVDSGYFSPKNNSLYCVNQEGFIFARRLTFAPGGQITLSADNAPEKSLTGFWDDFHILGRIIWMGRTLI